MLRTPRTSIPLAVAAFLIGGCAATAALAFPAGAAPGLTPTGSTFSSGFGPGEITGAVGRELVLLKARRVAEFAACRGPKFPARPC